MSVSVIHGVSAGPVVTELDEELRAVYQGGESYIARIQLIERQKAAAAAIIAEAEIVTTAKAYRAEAEKERDAAQKANTEAQQTLSSAKKRAKEMQENAQETADKRRQEAAEVLSNAKASSESLLKEANEQAAQIKATAEASSKEVLAAAAAEKGRATKLLADAQARDRECATATARMAKQQAEIDQKAARLKAAQDALSAALE